MFEIIVAEQPSFFFFNMKKKDILTPCLLFLKNIPSPVSPAAFSETKTQADVEFL